MPLGFVSTESGLWHGMRPMRFVLKAHLSMPQRLSSPAFIGRLMCEP
jgi:hypothetical protein